MKSVVERTPSFLRRIILATAFLALASNTVSLTLATADEGLSAPSVVAPAQPAAAAPATSAPGVATAAAAPNQPGMMSMAMPFLIMLGIMYFLMIRPQQKKMKEHQNLLSQLKAGDEVVTTSGIIGTIAGLTEKVVTIEVAKNVQLKVMKTQVNQVVTGPL